MLLQLVHAGPPEVPPEHNQTVIVDNSEEVTLNCTVSSSPDSLYSWSIPNSCASCPNSYNDSIMFLNASIANSGNYICVAKNDYGNVSVEFNVNVNCK